jgi:2-succinyl-5-enolpyruvyl-6-hydroxy-3-cyclohexene-1-carboxylate synthase
VVVAGGLGGAASHPIGDLARRAGWPLIAEPHSGARHGAMALRATDPLLRDPAFTAAHRPDLVVVAGRVGLSRALLDWLATVPHLVVSPDGGNWDVTRTAEAVVHAPLDVLAGAEVTAAPAQWAQDWHTASSLVSERVDAIIDSSQTLTEPRVARDVAALLPDHSALVVASSMPIRDLDLTMPLREHLAVFANRGVSGIDGFVSTAQGIAIAYDRGPTVALCGDLSLLHDVNGLMPGPDARPDVTYVVVNNDGGGIFSLLPQASSVAPEAFERLFGTPHGMSFEQVAAAYDLSYTAVAEPSALASALSSFDGVRLVEIRTDRAENATLHARLREVTARTA